MTGAKESPAWELQKAEYARLISGTIPDIDLNPVKVYENVPANTPPPYVKFSSFYLAEQYQTNTTAGVVARTQIDMYSQRASREEVCLMLAAVKPLMSTTKLTLTGFSTIRQVVEFERVFDESTPERPQHHAVLEMTYNLQQD